MFLVWSSQLITSQSCEHCHLQETAFLQASLTSVSDSKAPALQHNCRQVQLSQASHQALQLPAMQLRQL